MNLAQDRKTLIIQLYIYTYSPELSAGLRKVKGSAE